MVDLPFSQAPEGTHLLKYDNGVYSFAYPSGGRFAKFDHHDGSTALRLVVDTEDGTRLRFNIEPKTNLESARAAAEIAYESASEYFEQDNVPPHQLSSADFEGWRCRKRFVDGLSAPLIIDIAFLEIGQSIYQIKYATFPSYYNKGRWIFETILQTFAVSNKDKRSC